LLTLLLPSPPSSPPLLSRHKSLSLSSITPAWRVSCALHST
jgi:hypothetical protein